MLDLSLQAYIDWKVKPVMRIKQNYGYRVILKYQDGSERTQQKSGYKTQRDAKKAREQTIGELYSGTYIVYADVSVREFMEFWLENDIKKRVDSYNTYYSYSSVVKNHINPALGSKKMAAVNQGDAQKLYNMTAEHSGSVAKQLKTVMNLSFRYAVSNKVVSSNPVKGVRLPKKAKNQKYHTRTLDVPKTLTLDQINLLLEKSRNTPIHMQVLFNVLMGLRCSEIIGLKYTDVDYVNRTLKVERQLGRKMGSEAGDVAPKTLTKQEIKPKTSSSIRELPIPDYVFEAILREREVYEKRKRRRKSTFQDLGYICCSSYGRPRCKDYHWKCFKKLLAENGLPDIRWHDLRSTYCTLLLKNNHNPKAVSKLMGHAKEIITMDVYGDNQNMIAESIPELEAYVEEVLPVKAESEKFKVDLLDVEVDVTEYLPTG